MYGIFTYIELIFFGRCIQEYTTYMHWSHDLLWDTKSVDFIQIPQNSTNNKNHTPTESPHVVIEDLSHLENHPS